MPDAIKISSFDLKDNLLVVKLKEPTLSNEKKLKLLIFDRKLNTRTNIEVELIQIETEIGFALPLEHVPFLSDGKSMVDLYIYNAEGKPLRLFKQVPDIKERSLKYLQTPYHMDNKKIAIMYLTLDNKLSILYGSKGQVYRSFCTYTTDKIFIEDLKVRKNELYLKSGQIDFNNAEDFYFVIKKRNSKDSRIISHEKIDNHTVKLDLLDRDWNLKSRYDLFLYLKNGRVIQTLRVLINEGIDKKEKFEAIDVNELKVLPYVTIKGEISFFVLDHWLYEYELSDKKTHRKFFEKVSIDNKTMIIKFRPNAVMSFFEHRSWSLVIKKNNNTNSILLDPPFCNYNSITQSLEIDIEKIYLENELDKNDKWEFFVKVFDPKKGHLKIYKLKQQNVYKENSQMRYLNSIVVSENTEVLPYLTTNNDLGIIFGEKFAYQKLAYKKINNKICIRDLNYIENVIEFKLSDIQTNQIEMLIIKLKARKSDETWTQEIDPAMISGEGTITLNLEDFVDQYQYNQLRWDVYIEVAYGNVIEMGKVGCFYDEVLPKHLRYFSPIATRGINVFVPYLTIYNELSIVVNGMQVINNEKITSKISLTNFQMKKAKIAGTVEVELPEAPMFKINSILMKYRGKADEVIEYEIPVKRTESNQTKRIITFEIDLAKYEFQPFYWDLYVLADVDGSIFPLKIKNPSPEVKGKVDDKITQYSYTFTNGYFIYPYISAGNTLALTYREKPSYESNVYKIKEKLAYYTYRVFSKYLDKQNIWLGYEKFSEGAQDNGYYFFKYCYEKTKKKNFFYIIKKDSPDYENISGMKDKVVEFMSFKYMVLMYASNLLVSSESKGHAYDIRIQKGKLKKALDKKKHVFLQHGVTALKRVDYVFKKTKNNAVDLFVATSDYEKNIIKEYFNYDDKEIITTGFCRWDVLEDTSGSNKEIFVMPTWRTWMDDLPEEQFIESDYYKNYVGFFKSERLKSLLEKHDVKLSFYIHPKFKTYIDSFSVDNNNIKIYQYGEEKVNKLLMETSMLITDYSSVAWEMYYQKKPVVFFQFDVEKYNAFQGSYLDMETELFGDRVLEVEELVDSVQEYIERDFKEKEEFGLLRSKYFKYVDKKNCERTYKAIQSWIKKKK